DLGGQAGARETAASINHSRLSGKLQLRRPGRRMKLIVAAVGARMPAWVDEAWKDYAKRLPPDCALELREIKPEPRSSGKSAAQLMAAEARRIEAALPAGCHRVALDERGRDLTTMQLSRRLEHWRT